MLALIRNASVKLQIPKRRQRNSQFKRRRNGECALTRLHRSFMTIRLFAHAKRHVFWNQRTHRKNLEIVRNVERREFHVENNKSAGKMWILIFPLTLTPSTIINTGVAAHCRVVLPSLFLSALPVQQHTAIKKFI